MFMSRDQNAERSHNIKTDNSSLERVEEFNIWDKHYHINTLNAGLNPIWHLLALLGAHPILHVSRIRVKYHSGRD